MKKQPPSDHENLAVTTDPRFLAIIEASDASYRAEGGFTTEQVRERLGIPLPKPKKKRR
jgi:hypothetical protein